MAGVQMDADTASQRSGSSSAPGSETSSQHSNARSFKKHRSDNAPEADDLELGQKRSFQEGMFSCMYTLVKSSALGSWQFAVIKIALEFLMNFVVAFNPSVDAFSIKTSNPAWQVIRWTVWRIPITQLYGYHTYVVVLYLQAAVVLLAVVSLVWLTLALRKQDQSRWLKRAAKFLRIVFDVAFVTCYVSAFDYFTFAANCNFTSAVKNHSRFPDIMCLEVPHLVHMFVALALAALYLAVTALMLIASSDLNPASKGYLASPAAFTRLRILAAKAVFVVCATCLDSNPKLQTACMTAAVLLVVWWNFRKMPFYRRPVNVVWTGLWFGILYPVVLQLLAAWGNHKKTMSPEARQERTDWVLYGTFPIIVGGALLTAVYNWWAMRPAAKFKGLTQVVKLSSIYKFDSVDTVERLSRVMRVFDIDGMVDPDAASHGEIIIKAGLQVFPGKPHLLILYSNFILEVSKDGPASRTQLQLAAKASPNFVQRYQIFCTQEASKRLKDSQDGGMDLQAYIEFKRNFRAVLRVHKEVLLMQAEVWQLCMRTTLKVATIDKAMEGLVDATTRASQVYERVLERYPNNGKLLRCYGKFLEGVKHDPVAAARVYGEANRQGGANALLALDLSGVQSAGKPEFLTSMSMEDDAVIVIDAEGTIMMVSQAVQKVFGYAKQELEGANISVLMPQPFSQRHASYMQRYVSTGEPHILDSVREVVAMHKDRYVFPVLMCVTKLSGVRSDSVFLGVVRPIPPNALNLRAWVAPNGVVLCADQQFASAIGVMEGELVGRPLASIVTQPAEAEALLERCRDTSAAEFAGGIEAHLQFLHRYHDPVPGRVTVRLAGTDGQRILVLNFDRLDGHDDSMLVCDLAMRIKFASADISLMLGYSMRKLATMKLDQLLPVPYDTLHAKWVKDPPQVVQPYGCRAGVVVQLVCESGALVPVQIKITPSEVPGSSTQAAGTLHIVQVAKVAAEDALNGRRLEMTLDLGGKVLAVSDPTCMAFDFPARKLLGRNVADFVDVFGDWADQGNDMQMLILALLYKEQENPGMSWRMRVVEPVNEGEEKLPIVTGAQSLAGMKGRASRSACVQVEMEEEGAEEDADVASTRVRLTLWRRDLMAGVVELDEDLVIRKASFLTGLITGLPSSFMHRKPLSRFLDIPEGATWDKLVSGSGPKKKSALKAAPLHPTVSPVLMYIGPHPDSGTMRLKMQGVHVPMPGGRAKIIATVHPDTTYTGAHANLMKVLKLETGASSVQGRPAPGVRQGGTGTSILRRHECNDEDETLGPSPPLSEKGGPTRQDTEAGPPTSLHRTATNKSEFIEQWVRTLSRLPTGAGAGAADAADQAAPDAPNITGREEAAREGAEAVSALKRSGTSVLATIAEGHEEKSGFKSQISRAISGFSGAPDRRDVGTPESMTLPEKQGQPDPLEAGDDKASESGDSSADGSQAASAFSATTDQTDASEAMIDARRGRLLKSLLKTVLGPTLATPLDRLRVHSFFCIAVLLIVHIIGFLIVGNIAKIEHTNVNMVHRQVGIRAAAEAYGIVTPGVVHQAMAMDRSQLVLVRTVLGTFCERANVTAKVSVCANTLSFTMGKLMTNVQLMEEYHQSVYLGMSSSTTVRPKAAVYGIYTEPILSYHIYLDTTPPRVITAQAGAWLLGNRFIAAAREALFLIPTMRDEYRSHRSFSFLLTNGLGPLFAGYSQALDHLVRAAWETMLSLRKDLIVMMVVEALVVQLLCTGYLLFLVHRLERARILGFLAMLGLPGPILRQLSNVDVKVIDDSSDGNEEEDAEAGKEADAREAAAREEPAAVGAPALLIEPPLQRVASVEGSPGPPGPGGRGDGEERTALEPKRFRRDSAHSQDGRSETSEDESSHYRERPLRVQGSKKARARGGEGSAQWTINGRTIVPSHGATARFMVPFLVWNIAVVVIYVISLLKLNGMQAPLASLNMACRVTYRYTRIRAIAAAFVTQDSKEDRELWRPLLVRELDIWEGEYDALMYGGLPASMADSILQQQAPAGTFQSAEFANSFFKVKECMRFDKSTCFPPGHVYYEATHNGLDAMVRRTITELRLLYLDADEDVSYDNPRYSYMAAVAGQDLYEGLQQAAQLFVDYSISRYNVVSNMHTILLAIACVLTAAYFPFLLYPQLSKAKRDATWQGSLLSLAPPEFDVRAHVRGVYRRAARHTGIQLSKK